MPHYFTGNNNSDENISKHIFNNFINGLHGICLHPYLRYKRHNLIFNYIFSSQYCRYSYMFCDFKSSLKVPERKKYASWSYLEDIG